MTNDDNQQIYRALQDMLITMVVLSLWFDERKVVGYNDIFHIKIYCRSANTASYFAPLTILESQDDVDVNRYL